MNKEELAEELMKNEDLSKAQCKRIISLVFNQISGALVKGEEVSISNFGKFIVVNRASYSGNNPQTGEKIQIPAAKKAKFKPFKQLEEALN